MSKERIKSELQASGQWQNFVTLRESLKAAGVKQELAWTQAYDAIKSRPVDQPKKNPQIFAMGPVAAVGHHAELFHELRGKHAAPAAVMHWVFDHAGLDIESLDPTTIPSAGALKLLLAVKKDDTAYLEFFRAYTKLLPTRQQIDSEARFHDDGRVVFEHLDAIEAELNADSTQGLGTERTLPPNGDGAGVPEQGSQAGNLDGSEPRPDLVDRHVLLSEGNAGGN